MCRIVIVVCVTYEKYLPVEDYCFVYLRHVFFEIKEYEQGSGFILVLGFCKNGLEDVEVMMGT